MNTFTCDCKVCNGVTFTDTQGRISGTPKQVRDMTHSYAQMFRNQFFAPKLAEWGFVKVA